VSENIPQVAWRSKRPSDDLEVLELSELAPRVPEGVVERMQFHIVVLYVRGVCWHEVDFELHECRPGTLVHVQPGQVQRFGLHDGVEGFALLFRPAFLFVDRPRVGALWSERFFEDVAWPAAVRLAGEDHGEVRQAFERLARVAAVQDGRPLTAALLRHMLAATLLDVARRSRLTDAPSLVAGGERARARELRAAVDRSFKVTRSVLDYAERLGCSTRTLDRLSRTAFGVSAKAYIDARVVLEAKRLLVHTTASVAAIGAELGFSEPTNFVKFFKGRTGTLPGVFRARGGESVRARARRAT
jgi:AraC-like DNA-binding protein